jgi:hypothetical protein
VRLQGEITIGRDYKKRELLEFGLFANFVFGIAIGNCLPSMPKREIVEYMIECNRNCNESIIILSMVSNQLLIGGIFS